MKVVVPAADVDGRPEVSINAYLKGKYLRGLRILDKRGLRGARIVTLCIFPLVYLDLDADDALASSVDGLYDENSGLDLYAWYQDVTVRFDTDPDLRRTPALELDLVDAPPEDRFQKAYFSHVWHRVTLDPEDQRAVLKWDDWMFPQAPDGSPLGEATDEPREARLRLCVRKINGMIGINWHCDSWYDWYPGEHYNTRITT